VIVTKNRLKKGFVIKLTDISKISLDILQ